jgi:hypothetical protein
MQEEGEKAQENNDGDQHDGRNRVGRTGGVMQKEWSAYRNVAAVLRVCKCLVEGRGYITRPPRAVRVAAQSSAHCAIISWDT